MQSRISSDTSSDEEMDVSALAPEELAELGLSNLFDHSASKDRRTQASEQMSTLLDASFTRQRSADSTKVSREYFTYLSEFRKSEYYLGLQERLNKNQKLTPQEYTIYAMTTANVNALDPDALRKMTDYLHVDNFDANLKVLIAVRDWQNAVDPAIKTELNKALRYALIQRGSVRNHVEMFLNLHGANLQGADLNDIGLDYTDLRHANLSYANVYGVGMHYSNLDNANLSYGACVSEWSGAHTGPSIKCSSARNACFDNIDANNLDWGKSDFTGASFKFAKIGPGHFTDAIFDGADFTGGELNFSRTYTSNFCSLKGTNLAYANIVGADYSRLDLTGATLFIAETFTNTDDLNRGLLKANKKLLNPIREADSSEWYKESEIKARQNVIAHNVVFHLGKSSLSDTEKLAMLDSALNHPIFQPEKTLHQLANWAGRSLYAVQSTLFGSTPHHEVYATEAIKILEEERDAVAARCTTPTPN
jgi:hypothetical protein